MIERHGDVLVVRDDLYPGGTKARFIPALFEAAEEIVYASPAEGGAQTALAEVARQMGKKATIFVAKRAEPHPRSLMAKALGAKVLQVTPGYLNVVQARAEAYAAHNGATLAPFGFEVPQAIPAIRDAALIMTESVDRIDEVWCAGGSGVLARGLKAAFPEAELHVVQVGKALDADALGAIVHVHPLKFGQTCRSKPPFPSDMHYDAKAWELCVAAPHRGTTLFWNVTGPANA